MLRMGLAESIEGLKYTRMSLVPETDYTPFPGNWRPDHEKALLEFLSLDDPKTLEDQRNCIKEQGLISLQDYISMLVWNYKRNASLSDQLSLLNSGGKNIQSCDQLEMESSNEDCVERSEDEEEDKERINMAHV